MAVSLEMQILPYCLIHLVFLVILVYWMNANLAFMLPQHVLVAKLRFLNLFCYSCCTRNVAAVSLTWNQS